MMETTTQLPQDAAEDDAPPARSCHTYNTNWVHASSWSSSVIPPMNESRFSHAAAVLKNDNNSKGESIVVLGGYIGYTTASSVALLQMSKKTSTWKCLSPCMTEERAGCVALVVEDAIYAIGGYGSKSMMERLKFDRLDSDDDFYNMNTKMWHPITSTMEEQEEPSRGGCAAVVADDTILIFGGLSHERRRQVLVTVPMYNLTTKQWKSSEEEEKDRLIMPTPRAYHVAVRMGTKVYLVGGEDNEGNVVSSVHVLNLTNFTWTTLSKDMPQPSKYCAATAIDETHFVVAGGRDANDAVLATVWLFDCDSEEWTLLPGLSQARSACALVKRGSSTLVVLGGKGADGRAVNVIESLEMERN